MFGTDVLNKKSMVGQVRERFRKGRSQEMEIFWKESTAKSVPFFRVFARYKQAFFTSIPNSGINCVKICIFKHYSRMTSVLGPGKLTKSIDLERQVSNSDFCVPFHLLLFCYRSTWFRQSLEEYVFRESLRQTRALLWLGLKQKFIFPFSRIFKFRVNGPNIPIFSRKC